MVHSFPFELDTFHTYLVPDHAYPFDYKSSSPLTNSQTKTMLGGMLILPHSRPTPGVFTNQERRTEAPHDEAGGATRRVQQRWLEKTTDVS